MIRKHEINNIKTFTLVFFLLFSKGFAQEKEKTKTPFPKSIVDFGIGAGPNYGIFGAKTVIGYKGNGLLVGTGVFTGLFAFQLGAQASYKWFFANLCYGTMASVTNENTGTTELANGMIFMGGGKINLTKNKKLFLELGLGYTWGAYLYTPAGSFPLGGVNAVSGLNYRFTFKKKTDGAPSVN
jgi:hypothetical protein